jgi:hypothetical protein
MSSSSLGTPATWARWGKEGERRRLKRLNEQQKLKNVASGHWELGNLIQVPAVL